MALIKCPECGKEVSDKARICIHCGYPLHNVNSDEVIYCPYCGKENSMDNTFCGYCGKSFSCPETLNTSTTNNEITDIMSFKHNIEISTAPARLQQTQIVQQQQLAEQQRQLDMQAKCPRCGSTSLSGGKQGFGVGKAVAGAVLFGGLGILAGGIGANKTVVTCLNCGYQFKL